MKLECNICLSTDFKEFNGRPNAMCKNCGGTERSRLLWHVLDKLIEPGHKVLHFAPEEGIYNHISERLSDRDYIVADIEPHRYKFTDRLLHLDMTDLDDLPSNHYDFIIHSHVLEHVPCNEAYTLFHLHRALKETGRHIFVVPLAKGHYDCTYTDIGRKERERRFGQWDHVRVFGRDDIEMGLGKLINLPYNFNALSICTAKELEKIAFPKGAWSGLSVHTPINLGKYDMKFLDPKYRN